MDGGEVSLEGFGVDSLQSSHHKSKVFASAFLKQERSDLGEEQWRPSKFLKADNDFSVSKSTPVHIGTPVPRSEQILSFSSLKPEIAFYSKGGAGYGLLSGSRGPFTPAQWIELEHQALIYKYILANVPVPSNLLLPIRRSFNLSASTVRSFNPNSFGWGSFHLGFSGNTDSEIGRCRRTDGKKWRCSRDAVVDQKYCEKHMNRGRHRSRKPVEGQYGHASASSAATNANMVSIASSTTASVITSGGASSVLSLEHTQFKNLPPSTTNPSADTLVNRVQDSGSLSRTSTTTTQEVIPLEDSSQTEFGLVSSNSLMNPSQATSYMSPKGYGSLLSHSIISWPKDPNTDWTQLTMSIPVASSDISSSASSPATDLVGPTWGASVGGPLGEVLTNTSMRGPSPTGAPSISSSINYQNP